MPKKDETKTEPFYLNVGDPDVRANLYETYAGLRSKSPVTRALLTAGEDMDAKSLTGATGREVYLITAYDEASAMMSDDRYSVDPRSIMTPEQLAQMPAIPKEYEPLLKSMQVFDPPDHTRLRRLVQPSFTPRKIEELRPNVQRLTDELLDTAEREAKERGETAPNRRMDLLESFAYPLPLTVILEMLGVPQSVQVEVRDWTSTWTEYGIETEEYRNALNDFIAFLHELFADKRANPANDLTSELVHAEEEGDRLNEDELLSMVFILIFGGHITTVNLVSTGIVQLLNHPDQRARLEADPELVKNAVEEILRYSGSVEMLVRHAKEDVELAGTVIPKGSGVMAVMAAADRDPARFPQPDVFDIARPEANRHLAFARGVHVCLGAPLARMEGQVAIGTIFRRYPDLRLEDPNTKVELLASQQRGVENATVLF